jgi:uncharacterized membrane protein YhaH (DUF805 family)
MQLMLAGIIAAVLSVLVSTQIELVHDLSRTGLVISFIAVWLVLMATNHLLTRRLRPGSRYGAMFLLFLIVWALNSASSLTRCERGHINCHRVFSI